MGFHRAQFLVLFYSLIYVNDLAEKINTCSLIQYADDTQFPQADNIDNLNNLISNREDTLRDIKRYFLTNGLLLNPPKRNASSLETDSFYQEIPLTLVSIVMVCTYTLAHM